MLASFFARIALVHYLIVKLLPVSKEGDEGKRDDQRQVEPGIEDIRQPWHTSINHFTSSFFFFFGGGSVSPLLRYYCIFNDSIHFTLEWSPIQVLTMAQVA